MLCVYIVYFSFILYLHFCAKINVCVYIYIYIYIYPMDVVNSINTFNSFADIFYQNVHTTRLLIYCLYYVSSSLSYAYYGAKVT